MLNPQKKYIPDTATTTPCAAQGVDQQGGAAEPLARPDGAQNWRNDPPSHLANPYARHVVPQPSLATANQASTQHLAA